MNRLLAAATILIAFVLTGCVDTQSVINEKKNGIFLIANEVGTDPNTGQPSGGIGTGFLIADNEIMTNAHVVNNSKKLTVYTESGKSYEAEVMKIEPVIDLAMIKLKDWDKFKAENHYEILTIGDSRKVQTLDEVYAVGNPWGLTFSISKGVVSNTMRRMEAIPKFLIQTDAHVYNGNSGGPLLNKDGEVIGINSLMMAKEGGSYGFAIHADTIKKVLKDWETGLSQWATIGVTLKEGNIIDSVLPDSPAAKAGLKEGDKIVAVDVNGQTTKVDNAMDTTFALSMATSPSMVGIIIDKQGQATEVLVSPMYKGSSEFEMK